MAKLSEADLKREIKNSSFRKFYFLYGEEKMLVSSYTRKLIEKICGKNPSDFNFHKFTENSPIDKIIPALDIIPFSSEYNCVYVEDFGLEKLSDSDMKTFLKAVDGIPDGTILIISMKTLSPSGKKPAVWKKLIEKADKCGVCVEFGLKTVPELRKILISRAEKNGFTLSPENAARITEYAGTDLNTLKNELDKLCAFAGSGTITTEQIEMTVTKNLSARVFDLTDAITSGDVNASFHRLGLLFYQREEPVIILAEIANTYVDMYRVRMAVESGMRAEEVAKNFDYKRKEFRLKKAERSSSRLTTDTISRCLEYIAQTNSIMNSSGVNKRSLLEQLVMKLITAGGYRVK